MNIKKVTYRDKLIEEHKQETNLSWIFLFYMWICVWEGEISVSACFCVLHMRMHIHVCMCDFGAPMSKSGFFLRHLSHYLIVSTYFFWDLPFGETKSAILAAQLVLAICLFLTPSLLLPRVRDICHHSKLLYGFWESKLRFLWLLAGIYLLNLSLVSIMNFQIPVFKTLFSKFQRYINRKYITCPKDHDIIL